MAREIPQAQLALSRRFGSYARLLVLVWTAVCATLLALNLWQNREVSRQHAAAEARAHSDHDQASGEWAAGHGDIRGGGGNAPPTAGHQAHGRRVNLTNAATMALLWLVGCAVIGASGRSLRRRIGERDDAMAALQSTHDLLRAERDIFVSGSVVVFRWRNAPDWPVEYVSANVEQVLGYPPTDFTEGRVAYAAIVHPDDLQRVGSEVAANSREGAVRFEHRPYRLRARGGDTRWVLDHTTVCRDDEGRITAYLGYLVDITELHEKTEALRVSEGRLALVMEGADLGLWDWHIPSGAVVFNERWARMLEYEPSEIEPHVSSWEKLVHEDDAAAVRRVLEDHLAGRSTYYECEQRLRTRAGTWKWILDRGKVIERDEQGRPVRAVGIHQDISERKDAEQKYIRQERLAAVGQLSAGIAHDFNNLLTGILGNTELLAESPALTPADREHVQAVDAAGRRAAALVRQILDFGQRTVRRPQTIDLAALLTESLAFLKSSIPENVGVELRVEDGDFRVVGDAMQLQQVVTNLAVNARQAMPKGGQLTIGLSIGPAEAGAACLVSGASIRDGWIRLEVADTGEGIAPDVLSRIFEPFFTTRPVGEGSGLGLSQVAGIVAQHGGHLTVRGRAGGGTAVTVHLPPDTAGQVAPPEPAPGPRRGCGEGILLVEDNAGVRRAVAMMLEHLGYRVLATGSGAEALAAFDAGGRDIALVISDMVMPDLSGADLFDELRARDPRLRMAIMSGYPLHDEGPALLERGLLAWVQKPLSLAALSDLLGRALDGSGSRES